MLGIGLSLWPIPVQVVKEKIHGQIYTISIRLRVHLMPSLIALVATVHNIDN